MAKEGHNTRNNGFNHLRSFRRKRFNTIWQDIGWWLVGGLGILALILGCIGFSRYFVIIEEENTGWDIFYRTMQLIVFEAGNLQGPVPWQLGVARFLLPAIAAYTAVLALLAIFSEQWKLLKLRFIKNHVVVCGVGERGLWLVEEFLSHGYKVVTIDKDDENPLLDQCRERGAVVLTGDATDRSLLRKVGVHKAKYLVAVCTDDGTNAEIALNARDLANSHKGWALTAFVHIIDLELCNLLSSWSLAFDETDSFRLEFFNVQERGARLMLNEYSPFNTEVELGEKKPHILVVGLGKMGRSLVVQAARNWWMKYIKSDKRLRISVIDKASEKKLELLRLQYPQLEKVCEFDIWQMEKNDPEFERGDFLLDSKRRCDVDIIYICFDDDVHVMVNALTLYRKTKKYKIPIIVRMSQNAGLATLIKENGGTMDSRQIHVFGLLDRTCSLRALLGGTNEILAQAIHESYVHHQKEIGATLQTNSSMTDWDILPEDLKESNRHQAAHIEVKLKAIDCGIQPLTDWDAASFKFLLEEVEQLAEMEHERWCEERRLQGWSYAIGPKNIKKKTSPHLVSWEELSEEVKEYNRNMVRNLPSFLTQAGFQIYRRT